MSYTSSSTAYRGADLPVHRVFDSDSKSPLVSDKEREMPRPHVYGGSGGGAAAVDLTRTASAKALMALDMVGSGEPPVLKNVDFGLALSTGGPGGPGSSFGGRVARAALREEVPVERRVLNVAIERNWGRISYTLDLLEGLVRSVHQLVLAIFKATVETYAHRGFEVSSVKHWEIYKAQKNGCYHSGKAVLHGQRYLIRLRSDYSNDNLRVGCIEDEMRWGTIYGGERTFSRLNWFHTNYRDPHGLIA